METKYNIGDIVWVVRKDVSNVCNMIENAVVREITISSKGVIRYAVGKQNGYITMVEENLHESYTRAWKHLESSIVKENEERLKKIDKIRNVQPSLEEAKKYAHQFKLGLTKEWNNE